MADILLSVGMQVGSADTKEFINQLKSIVGGLNSAENVKAKVGIQIDPASISDIRKSVSEISDFMKTSLGSVKVDSAGVSEFTSQLQQLRDEMSKMAVGGGIFTEIAKENALEAYRTSAQKAVAELQKAQAVITRINNEIAKGGGGAPKAYMDANSQFLREYLNVASKFGDIENRIKSGSRSNISAEITKITSVIESYNQLIDKLSAGTRKEFGLSAIQLPKYNLEAATQSTSAIKQEEEAVSSLNKELAQHSGDVAKAAEAETQKANVSQALAGALDAETTSASAASKASAEDAAAKIEQKAAYDDAVQKVNAYYSALARLNTNQEARSDLTIGTNGWMSMSGKYEGLAAQLNAAKTAFDAVTSAEAKCGLTAQQQADLQNLMAQRARDYALASEEATNKAAAAEEKKAAAAEAAAAKKAAAEEKAAAKAAAAEEKRVAAAKAAEEKRAAAAEETAKRREEASKKAEDREKQSYENTLKRAQTSLNQIQALMRNATPGSGPYKALAGIESQYKEFINGLRNAGSASSEAKIKLAGLEAEFAKVKGAVGTASGSIQLFGGGLSMLYSRINYFLSLSNMIMQAVRGMKQMIETTIELDASLTQLQIVTGVSEDTIRKYGITAAQTAQEIGGSTKDLIDSATVFARLGYTLEESNMLSKYTNMLQNVGAIDASTAQNAITAIVKAFDVDISQIESVMDKMVKVGNNFPISVSEIAEGMNNAGSALHAAGNSFEQSVALLTAANTTIQNISKSSTGLRTITARIRKTKVELDDLGETIEEAKYQEVLDMLTGKGVRLTENGAYRSTYEILKDIAAIWKDLSSMEQAAVAEQLSGTRQQNVFASIVEQFSEAEDAMAAMEDSTNALKDAYDNFIQSIQGHINTFKAAFAELAQNFTDSGFLKDVIDFGTKLLGVLNGVVQFTTKLGGLKTVILAVVSALLLLKPLLVMNFVTGAIDGIKNIVRGFRAFLDIIPACIAAWMNLASGVVTFDVALQATIPVIGLILAAITAVVAGVSLYNNKIEETKQKTLDAANSASSASAEISDLAFEYLQLSDAVKSDEGAKQDLIDVQDKLIDKLGVEQSRIRELAGEYNSYTDAIKAAITEKLREKRLDITYGVHTAEEDAKDALDTLLAGLGGYIAQPESELGITMFSIGRTPEAAVGMGADRGYILSTNIDISDIEGIVEMVDAFASYLEIAKGSLSTQEFDELYEIYSSIKGPVDDYRTQIGNLNRNLVELHAQQALLGIDIPTTANAFDEYRNSVIEAVKASREYIGSEEDIADSIDSFLRSQPEFTKFYQEQIDAQAEATGKQREITDKHIEWLNSQRDKIAEALYVDTGGEEYSQDYNTFRFRDSLGSLSEDELTKWQFAVARGAKTVSEAMRIVNNLTDENVSLITKFNELADKPFGEEFAKVLEDISAAADEAGMSISEFLYSTGAFNSATVKNIRDLTSLQNELQGATAALEEYNKAVAGEHGEVASQYDAAYDQFLKDWESGRTGTKAVQAAVELFLSDDALRDLDYDLKKAGDFLSSDFFKALFNTEDGDPGANFANYIRENQKLFAGVAQITENGEGGFDFAYSSIEDLAYVTGMSENAVSALLDSLDAYGIQVMMSAKDTAELAAQLGITKGQAVSTSEEIQNVANNLALSGKKSTEILQIMRSLEDAGYIDLSGVKDQLADIISGAGEYYQAPDESPLITIDADITGVESGVSEAERLLNEINGTHAKTYIDTEITPPTSGGSIDGEASGTTNASGGPTLVNELGPEIISENGRAYIAGGGRPTIVDLDRGAIVLNASDTRRALRGRMFKGVSIRAAAGGISGAVSKLQFGYISCPICGSRNPRSRKYCLVCGFPLSSEGIPLSDEPIKPDSATLYESLFGGGSGGGGGGGGGSSDEKEKQKIDWIVIAIDRIQRAVSKLQKVASSAFRKLDTRLKASKDAISEITEEIGIMQAGYERYLQEAESVGLDADLAERVRNGAIDINEYDEDTREKIQEYQQWYEKAIDCRDAIDDLHESIAQLYLDNFNNTQKDFENRLSEIEHGANMIEKDISMAEAHGYLESTQFYEALSSNTSDRITMLQDELSSLNTMFDEAMSSGEIEEGSEAWYEMKDAIAGVEEELGDANIQLVEYAKKMREIEWSYFDYAQEKLGQITEEADFLIELMSNKELFADNGQFTDYGLSTMGMHVVNYETAMAKADEYAAELQRIEREIASDPYNNDLIARREELLKLQRESILNAESEKTAVKDLVEQGIQKELSALQELIDAYKDSLDSAKDLYEYQKKVTEQTSAIADLEKQLSAYQGDTSQENRARIQKLQKQLREAQTNLEETEREKSIADQKKMLDELYKEYEDQLNKRLDDIDALMDEMITIASVNRDTIQEIATSLGSEVGYNVTEDMLTVLGDEFSGYHGMFDHVTGIHVQLAQIHSLIAAMAEASGATKAYAKGGLIDYTGLAAVHGTPGNPEMVLSAADTERFLEAAALMRGAPALGDLTKYGSVGVAGFSGTVINGLNITIPIDHVQDYNDMIAQMQRDPKFDKLINTLTLDRVTGKSQLGKYGVRI